MKLLHIDASITGDNSISKQLTSSLIEQFKKDQAELEIIHYNLDKDPIAHLSNQILTGEAASEIGVSNKVMKDFQEADVIVIGAPMYNFSIPSQLKSWIDRIAVAGKTFRYTENGPEGLSGGKQVFIASVRGGAYSGELAMMDHQESYLSTVFGFLGITDVHFIRAEGVNMGAEQAASAIENAKSGIAQLLLH